MESREAEEGNASPGDIKNVDKYSQSNLVSMSLAASEDGGGLLSDASCPLHGLGQQ